MQDVLARMETTALPGAMRSGLTKWSIAVGPLELRQGIGIVFGDHFAFRPQLWVEVRKASSPITLVKALIQAANRVTDIGPVAAARQPLDLRRGGLQLGVVRLREADAGSR